MKTIFKRIILLAYVMILPCISMAADVATYNSTTGSLKLPIVVVGSEVYDVDMQQTNGLNFDVTQAALIPIVDTLDYYNFQSGMTWRYQGFLVDDNGTTLETWSSNRTVQGATIVDGLSCYFISEPSRYRNQITHVCYDDESVYHIEDNNTRFKMHDRFAYTNKLSSWNETAFNLFIESEADFVNVSTPAYSGEALVFTNNVTDPISGYTWSEKVYLAEGVGLIKAVNDDDDGNRFYQNRKLVSYSQ